MAEFHEFEDIQPLYANQLNALRDNGTPKFTSTAARDAKYPSPSLGQKVWVNSIGEMLWTGTQWQVVTTHTSNGTQPTLLNGYTNIGNGFEVVRYRRQGTNRVYLEGVVTVANGGIIFTLPAGYRPLAHHTFACASSISPGFVRVTVYTGGNVQPSNHVNGEWISLDGIDFQAA